MRRITLVVLMLAGSPSGAASVLVDDRFVDFAGSGLAPGGGGGTLDSRLWAVAGASDGDAGFGDTRLAGDLARGRSPGGERAGGLYAFDLPGAVRGLGVQATGSDFTPGTLTRRLVHEGTMPVHALVAAFDLWVLNDGARSTRMTVQVSLDPVAGWHDLDGLTLETPGAPDAAGWQRWPLTASLPVGTLLAGAALLLRWRLDDAAGTGSRDEVALAGLRVTGAARTPAARALAAPACTAPLALAMVLAAVRAGRRALDGRGVEGRRCP